MIDELIKDSKMLFVSVMLAFLAIFGGVLLPWLGDGAPDFVLIMTSIMLLCSLPAMFSGTGKYPDLWLFFTPIFIAMLVSLGINQPNNQIQRWMVQLIFLVSSIAALFFGHVITGEELKKSLFYAGAIWLILFPVFWISGAHDNKNLIGFWAVLFIVITLETQKKWYYIIPFLAVILWCQSRGAIIGLTATLLVFYRPKIDQRRIAAWLSVGFVAGALLIAIRPYTAFVRLSYWEQATRAFVESPIAGVGPGAILSKRLIVEPPRAANKPPKIQPHAHNGLINYITENGLIGAAGLAIGLWWLYKHKHEFSFSWQWAVIAGALAHSLVDWPLWYYGPLVVTMIITGSIRKKEHGKNS